jgi:hypothetical protein
MEPPPKSRPPRAERDRHLEIESRWQERWE